MNALAGASVGDAADTDRPITAAAAPVARKERRLCVGDCSVSPLEEEAETAERWLRRHDGRTMTTVDRALDVEGVETVLDAGSLCTAEAIVWFSLAVLSTKQDARMRHANSGSSRSEG